MEIRFDLEALYKKACSNFDEQKKWSVKSKYKGLFSESDKDSGHTYLVKHRINIENAQPVKKYHNLQRKYDKKWIKTLKICNKEESLISGVV